MARHVFNVLHPNLRTAKLFSLVMLLIVSGCSTSGTASSQSKWTGNDARHTSSGDVRLTAEESQELSGIVEEALKLEQEGNLVDAFLLFEEGLSRESRLGGFGEKSIVPYAYGEFQYRLLYSTDGSLQEILFSERIETEDKLTLIDNMYDIVRIGDYVSNGR